MQSPRTRRPFLATLRLALLPAVLLGLIGLFAAPPVAFGQSETGPEASPTPVTISADGHKRPIAEVDPAQDRSQWATLGAAALLMVGVLVASFLSPKRNVDN